MTTALQIEGLRKSFGQFEALKDITLEMKKGEFLTMLGPSGSGKSTTLQIVAGFLKPDSGRVAMMGRDLSGIPPHKRNIGMVFQDYALFPHMTITDNVAFPLESRGIGKAKRRKRAEEILDVVNLGNFLGRMPKQLSGGQRQRVALARALVYDPEIVLLDEPLGALDKKLRTSMQMEILRVTRRFGATVISVTHDQEEALVMSDRIALFSHGQLAQVGTPRDLYANPNSTFVADFIGESNLLSCELKRVNGRYVVEGASWNAVVLDERVVAGACGKVTLLLRPECLKISSGEGVAEDSEPGNRASITVKEKVYLGSGMRIFGTLGDGSSMQIAAPESDITHALKPGSTATVSWHQNDGIILQY
ncbi:ABC transporter ATP-binding protein [Paraburkholderia sp. BCC1885]|uniref:ABC transporter ATP-binding protein n=1 Tax=Paraburkholderia sp. BCC1885 TaxID=2562669 RepID=UPI0011820C3C|nr:ABC transporter ATP-binding protein [Paraburkholderia sp. BCC1885]